MRAAMLEEFGRDYLRTARAKGLRGRMVLWRHLLKNALTPVVTTLSFRLGTILTGAFFIEVIFGIPGFGEQAFRALRSFDYPLLMGTTIVGAGFIIAANFIADISYALLDPTGSRAGARIDYQWRKQRYRLNQYSFPMPQPGHLAVYGPMPGGGYAKIAWPCSVYWFLIFFLLASFVGPYLSPYDYFTTDLSVAKQGPSSSHWMGTDTLGRDVLTRILYGGRTAMLVGFMVVGLSTTLGIILGGG